MNSVLKILLPLVCTLSLLGCETGFSLAKRPDADNAAAGDSGSRPAARPAAAAKPGNAARTVEQFDTTSTSERARAVSAGGGGRRLGRTIGSLGDVGQPGFWLKTPLVSKQQPGRVSYPASGKSVQVTLIPIEGPQTAGSRVSLAALRLLQAPLTGLPELIVYAR